MSASASARTRVLSTAEAADELGVSERTLRRYIGDGLIGYRRLPGGHYRIPAEAIEEFWQRHSPPPKRSGGAPLVARPRPRGSAGSKPLDGGRRPRLISAREPRSFHIPPTPGDSGRAPGRRAASPTLTVTSTKEQHADG